MNKITKIASLIWALIYLAMIIGLPIYQVHCDCTGQTTVTLLVAPENCNESASQLHHDQHQDGCHDHCTPHANQCDHTQVSFLQFTEIQDVSTLAPKLPDIQKTKLVALCCILSAIPHWSAIHLRPHQTPHDPQQTSPLIYTLTSAEYLHFICQLKEPSVA